MGAIHCRAPRQQDQTTNTRGPGRLYHARPNARKGRREHAMEKKYIENNFETYLVVVDGHSKGKVTSYYEAQEIYDDFSPDDHAVELYEAGKNGLSGVPPLSVLVEDAAEIEEMLGNICIDLYSAKNK